MEEPVSFDQPVAMEEREHTIKEAAVEPVARAREDADATPRIQGQGQGEDRKCSYTPSVKRSLYMGHHCTFQC